MLESDRAGNLQQGAVACFVEPLGLKLRLQRGDVTPGSMSTMVLLRTGADRSTKGFGYRGDAGVRAWW